MSIDHFKHLSLNKPILRALENEGYEKPTRIQEAAIPVALEGKDVLATSQTGTGKTAAFALPMLQLLHQNGRSGSRATRALILTPTRELALQIEASFRSYGRYLPLRSVVILGGVPEKSQIRALQKKPEIVIATPGRLIDLMSRGFIRLDQIEMLVLDEADRMLDMGFIHEVRRIVDKIPKARQTMFFSATLSSDISRLADYMLRQPTYIAVTPAASVSGNIKQQVLFVERTDKLALLTNVLSDRSVGRTLVFTRTKLRADAVKRHLSRHNISAESIHSNKDQKERQRALAAFDEGRVKVLVATDIVARGIDVDDISHVINFELPNEAENYVHRIGRTARAGAVGVAMSFCDFHEVPMLRAIERLTNCPLTAVNDHPYHAPTIGMIGQRSSSSRRPAGRRRMSLRTRRSRTGRKM
jgi:ATP-dependent RNA helicase RhlE